MRRAIFTVVVVLLAAGCPRRGTGTAWETAPLPETGQQEARARFDQARARFERAEFETARAELESIVREYPDDPIAPYASLFSGLSAHHQGDDAAAAAALEALSRDEQVPADVRRRARFGLGLTEASLGRHAAARALLEPFTAEIKEGPEAIELAAALAESRAGTGDVMGALPYYDRFFASARPAERAYILGRVQALVADLSPEDAAAAYGRAGKDGPSAAFLGQRLASAERAAGRPDRARQILSETANARATAGIVTPGGSDGAGDPQLVGAILPLSGKRRLVGEASARGLTLAASTYDRGAGGGVSVDGVPLPFEVVLEDAGEGKEQAAAAVETLARRDVIAAIGPVDRDAADEAARRAEALGLPLLTLDVTEPSAGGAANVFHAVISVEDRARALAAHAVAKGARRFAILGPDIAYGSRAAAAFRKEVTSLGGSIVVEERYPGDATAFVGPVGKLAKAPPFDALFIPDGAARLELVAPQLAVADLVVQPLDARKPKRGRAIFLLSTAEGLSPKFLRGSGRYSSGAAFAPGFYPDDNDERIGPYVARFRLAHGDDPTFLDAYAYDAALLVRAAVESGARDRAAVADALASLAAGSAVRGLTGDIWFDAAHARGDRGVLYTVVADGAGAFAIRAAR